MAEVLRASGGHLIQPPAQVGTPRADCPRPYADGFWVSRRTETPQSLDNLCQCSLTLSLAKKVFPGVQEHAAEVYCDLKMKALKAIYHNKFPWISKLVLNICQSCLKDTGLTTTWSTGWANSLAVSTINGSYPPQKHKNENRNYIHTPNMH